MTKTKPAKTFPIHQILVAVFVLSFLLQPGAVEAQPAESIQTVDLHLSTRDVARVEFGYHYSSFQSEHTEYKLDVRAGILTDGATKVPLSSLAPLLSGLKGMYPGTRPLYWESWSDDYPHAWINLHLNDGRVIAISSDSQFDGMFPWNVIVWSSEKATRPEASYLQLNFTFFDKIDALWRGVNQDGFPRKRYTESFWKELFANSTSDTVNFHNEDNESTAAVWGDSLDSLSLFLPKLIRNPELKTLLDAGYTVYDASFMLEAETRTLKPIQYSGTLALAAPDGRDVVIGLATLPLADGEPVTTTLNAAESMKQVEQRRASQFLNEAEQIISPLTFLLDTRDGIDFQIPGLNCPENHDIALDGPIVQAISNPAERMKVTFYPLTDRRWSVNLDIRRGDLAWGDATVQTILNSWFPTSIARLPIQNIQAVDTHWRIAFQPDVTLREPDLLGHLTSGLPEQTVIHEQNPEKAGDYGFLSLEGRVVLSEQGSEPVVVYCGRTFPDWYPPQYPIDEVVPPNEQAPRQGITASKNGEWLSLMGSLPHEQFRTQWTDIAFTQPGFLHVLWTDEREGVYYADGWIDGTGWTQPQRLGEEAYWLRVRAWPDGEIHLFWDAGLTTGGTIHVWRPAGGAWQKAEHWPEIGYFNNILRDASGTLHIGTSESDGLDSEFMHRTWSAGKGLSAPENISRQIGSGGAGGILRFDSTGRLHAAWPHILEEKSAPDPVTGETSDIFGIFYAYRLPDGHWSKPEPIGTLAAYAHAFSMELDAQDDPLIVWQADSGLFSRIRKNGSWEEPVELAAVSPPETPAEFGPDRWVRPTAELQTAVNSQGEIIVGWLIPYTGLKLAFWSGKQWTGIVDIVAPEERETLESEPLTLQMTVDDDDRVHLVFFKEDFGQDFAYYALYDHTKIETSRLSGVYDGYGLPEAEVLIDHAGSIAILELPRSPSFDIKLPPGGIPPTSTPAPTPTPAPIWTPTNTLTPLQATNQGGGLAPLLAGLVLLIVLTVIGIAVRRLKKKTP